MDPATSIATAEQALRDLIAAVMSKEHGASWMDNVVPPQRREEWKARREKEERQRAGHMFNGPSSDLDYAELGDLDEIIRSAGNWKELFAPALGAADDHPALMRVLLAALQRIRRPVAHTRALLPFEGDLVAGIAGLIRNRVTIYMSTMDPDENYYPIIERISDSLGNTYTTAGPASLSALRNVTTGTTLRVGDTVTFECQGHDPQDRDLKWELRTTGRGVATQSGKGSRISFAWTPGPAETGNNTAVLIYMAHVGEHYHRNVEASSGWDGVVIFRYRVLPPLA